MPAALADEERIKQIFYNLLGNALKFTEKGSIEIGGRYWGGELLFWVRDTGCGIQENMLEEIFKPFLQVSSFGNSKREGTGLGLSITKQLVELHGGEIKVKSTLGMGSEFSFNLSATSVLKDRSKTVAFIERINDLNEAKIKQSSYELINPESKYKLLVAEDDDTNLRALIAVLECEGYCVKAVHDGYQALEELECGMVYDLLILDIMMPKRSGFEVLKTVREKFSSAELPVILLTAKARQEDIKAGFMAGANDYIPKPFETEELKSRVSTLVHLKETVKSLVSAELSFLQAQIKPHFLYNTLSVIISLCNREPKKAQELLTHLSDYLRGSFRYESKNGLVFLGDELQTVEAYLAIEKARFSDRLEVEYDIDRDNIAYIPILSIQPLVENAVRHGIMKRIEGGTVKLTVKHIDEYIYISVEDDGVGISPEELERLFNSENGRGVGLLNIHKRLINLYGKGLEINSIVGKGTRVSMKLKFKE